MRHLLDVYSQRLLDILFPPYCIVCRSAENWLCQPCLHSLTTLPTTICKLCGAAETNPKFCQQCQRHPLQYINGIRSAVYFDQAAIRLAIHGLKYDGYRVLAEPLAHLLDEAYHRYNLNVDAIVPVPLHWTRLRERGFNQSHLLATHLGRQLDISVDATTLLRTHKTETQAKLSGQARRQNVIQAFECTDTRLQDKRILLIDDVCTTGSTLDACAKTLKTHGAKSVWGLTIAKA